MAQGFLAIDAGNTRLKATYMPEEGDFQRFSFEGDDAEGLLKCVEGLDAKSGAMSAVGHIDTRLVETLRNVLSGDFLLLTSSTQLPIEVDYADVATLGADRKIGACGAAKLFPGEGVLIADAGTAMTLDIIDPTGTFRGGNISPGLQMRFNALHSHTALLPCLNAREIPEPQFFGSSTEEALIAGAVGGMLDEIACAALHAGSDESLRVSRIILTGGDAQFVARNLAERVGAVGVEMPVCVERDLLAIGLKSVYDYQLTLPER